MKKIKTEDDHFLENYIQLFFASDNNLSVEENKKPLPKIFFKDHLDILLAVNDRLSAKSLTLRDKLNSQECYFSPEFLRQLNPASDTGETTEDINVFKKSSEPTKESGERVEETHRMVEELYKQFKPRSILPRSKHTINLVFPEVVQWSKVILKIKEGATEIDVVYGGKYIKKADYIELGFSANKKNHKPDRRWALLTIFSILQKKDIKLATPNTLIGMLESYGGRPIKRDNLHKIKQLLSEALKTLFGTEEDPFTDSKKYYEPKFKILPIPIMRTEEVWEQGGCLNENVDYGDLENGEE